MSLKEKKYFVNFNKNKLLVAQFHTRKLHFLVEVTSNKKLYGWKYTGFIIE